jgi:hypothetical protein
MYVVLILFSLCCQELGGLKDVSEATARSSSLEQLEKFGECPADCTVLAGSWC